MMFVITMKAKIIITAPMITKSIKLKPFKPNFSGFDKFCIVIACVMFLYNLTGHFYFAICFCTFSITS